MRLEATRAIAAWLRDGTYGYAAKLAGLSLDGSDARPATVLDASILSEADDVNAAFGRFDGLTMPAIIVSADDVQHRDPEMPQLNTRADAALPLRVRYCERTLAAPAAIANASYAMKAIVGSLRELSLNANVASRTRNSVRLVSLEGMVERGLYEEVDDTWLVATLELEYYTVNILPMGA